jgi:hypothetical protein
MVRPCPGLGTQLWFQNPSLSGFKSVLSYDLGPEHMETEVLEFLQVLLIQWRTLSGHADQIRVFMGTF